MQNSQTTLLNVNDLRAIGGGSYYKLPVIGGPICELPAPVQPGYPTTDPVSPTDIPDMVTGF